MTETPEAEPATNHHQTITDLRRELVTAHASWSKCTEAYSAARGGDNEAARDAYAASLMAASYSYILAAVLGVAERECGAEVARRLAFDTAEMLVNGDFDRLNADVWPDALACKHCRKPIEPCRARRSHGGCASSRGYIHVNGGHACEQGGDGPYATPTRKVSKVNQSADEAASTEATT